MKLGTKETEDKSNCVTEVVKQGCPYRVWQVLSCSLGDAAPRGFHSSAGRPTWTKRTDTMFSNFRFYIWDVSYTANKLLAPSPPARENPSVMNSIIGYQSKILSLVVQEAFDLRENSLNTAL